MDIGFRSSYSLPLIHSASVSLE